VEYRVLGPLEAEFAFEPFAQVEIGRLEDCASRRSRNASRRVTCCEKAVRAGA
jgi:hypothetical protein